MGRGRFFYAVCSISLTSLSDCPSGFVRGIYGIQCYMVNIDGRNWTDSRAFCESKGAYVAELIEPEERNAMYSYAQSKFTLN